MLSEEGSSFVVTNLKSLTSTDLVGRDPLTIPGTGVTAEIWIELVSTLVTLPMVGSVTVSDGFVYSTRFPTLNNPGRASLVLLTVLTPPEALVIVATPTAIIGVWTTSAAKVLTPTSLLLLP